MASATCQRRAPPGVVSGPASSTAPDLAVRPAALNNIPATPFAWAVHRLLAVPPGFTEWRRSGWPSADQHAGRGYDLRLRCHHASVNAAELFCRWGSAGVIIGVPRSQHRGYSPTPPSFPQCHAAACWNDVARISPFLADGIAPGGPETFAGACRGISNNAFGPADPRVAVVDAHEQINRPIRSVEAMTRQHSVGGCCRANKPRRNPPVTWSR